MTLTVGDVIASAMFKQPGMGGPAEPITDLYQPEGVAIIVANALGIDPALSVASLQQRLLWGSKVEALRIFPVNKWTDEAWSILYDLTTPVNTDTPSQ
jgi:hypothetical protein